MSAARAGNARGLAAGRLANFEDEEDLPQLGAGGSPELTLPPRKTRPAQQLTAVERPAAPAQEPDLASTEPDLEPEESSEPPPVAGPGVKDRVRGSNVYIELEFLDPLTAKCQREGLSHGEAIIVAIEAAYPRLPELLNPTSTAGGHLFSERRSHVGRSAPGPVTPLNYRMRQSDFDTLDELVQRLGANSRTQLINAALRAYFAT